MMNYRNNAMLAHRFTAASALCLTLLFAPGVMATAKPDGLAYCRADIARLCPGVPPGGGRVMGCLKYNKMNLSVGCAMTLRNLKAEMRG